MPNGNRSLKAEARRIQRATGVKYTEALRAVELTRAGRATPLERMMDENLHEGMPPGRPEDNVGIRYPITAIVGTRERVDHHLDLLIGEAPSPLLEPWQVGPGMRVLTSDMEGFADEAESLARSSRSLLTSTVVGIYEEHMQCLFQAPLKNYLSLYSGFSSSAFDADDQSMERVDPGWRMMHYGVRADDVTLADTGLVSWQQGPIHCFGRAILWEHRGLYVTVGTWDEYRDEAPLVNPFSRSTRSVNPDDVELPTDWEDQRMTEAEAVLWGSVGLELEEKPAGHSNWRGEDLRSDAAATARRIESDLYLRDRSLHRSWSDIARK